jgi:hypothetical protein
MPAPSEATISQNNSIFFLTSRFIYISARKTAPVSARHVIVLDIASIEFHIYLAQFLFTVEVLSSVDVRF